MTDIVVKSFLNNISSKLNPYIDIYSTYMPPLGDITNVFRRKSLLNTHLSKLSKDLLTNVICGYSRSSIRLNSDYRNNRNVHTAYLSDDVTQFKITDFKMIQFDIDVTFMSTSMADIELIENSLVSFFSTGRKFEITITIPDMTEPLTLLYMIDQDTNSNGNIELVDSDVMGSLWTLSCSFSVSGAMLSMESVIYPRLFHTIIDVYGTTNYNTDTATPDARATQDITIDPNGNIVSVDNSIISYKFVE